MHSSFANPAYYDKSTIIGPNRFWYCPPDSFMHRIPLAILYSGYSFWTKNDAHGRDISDIFSIELVTAGNMIFIQNGKQYLVNPGQAFITHKGRRHVYRTGPAGFMHKRMAILDGVMLEIVLQSIGIIEQDIVSFANPGRMIAMIKSADKIIGTQQPGYTWELTCLAYNMLIELGKNIAWQALPKSIAAALEYMNHNLDKNLTLKDIATRAGLSVFSFSRLFSKSAHCSPITFFLNQKMSFAKNLLSTSTLLIKEVSSKLGFEDPLYFSAQFKKYTGMSPREFRIQSRREAVHSHGAAAGNVPDAKQQ
jgi:AraC-like DNA-binding protein